VWSKTSKQTLVWQDSKSKANANIVQEKPQKQKQKKSASSTISLLLNLNPLFEVYVARGVCRTSHARSID
jgi:hypothetical protein